MPKTRQLLREEITYSVAKEKETNILQRLSYVEKRDEFFGQLKRNTGWIKSTITHHIGLHSPNACQISDEDDWLYGSFNVCIPVTVDSKNWRWKRQYGNRLMFRLPLPYRVAETFRPGSADEKVRCEAATYSFFQQHCTDVPLPRLYGFGLTTGETFTELDTLPFLMRGFFKIKNFLRSLFRLPLPSKYVRHQPRLALQTDEGRLSYMLLEYIEDTTGEMLSATWKDKQNDAELRANLFRGISRILLSITRIKLPKIGSFTMDNKGYISLTNRPLTYQMLEAENESIPTDIPRDRTYSTVESYTLDMLNFHDNRILHQPNAINDLSDYSYQTAALTTMRAILPSFLDQKTRYGPFVLCFGDFNQSNIFVDKNWNITCLLDLEWMFSQPIDLVRLPTWLSNQALDELAHEPEHFTAIRKELVDILADEEKKWHAIPSQEWTSEIQEKAPSSALLLSTALSSCWETGAFWYSLALHNPTALFSVFYERIQPKFLDKNNDHDAFQNIVPWYWATDFVDIALEKVEDKKNYDIQLQQAFEDST
ncbi:hypothetical protein LOZ53_003180 [Ophidiomyces ophidiicola]|uniref:uncharacterized protein n=1 Tax=Ophidiomyces ophidiicola TaxID=1387563 RepID=UPI0020C4807B|nr:uncharacterized protein LOZ57_003872 [Ophidiomyces ophidiicola]KAI1946120.1 hypothetical protein LOZ57_003872 [Ophidiomyces ophidiicola]KAI1978376.1 hypothetical protein LOZ55_002705 [Ophidiomyces ophidiicola]KAI1990598.1 hypothetical protein LOZ53_003180 [Ophidiomyces ophidiicola]KAI1994234.1 hypothetical protein LOZ54_001078 [Ophidiomyces ophidiicola]KAI2003006.1 hypothetical protein LOZ51_000079 [Ophidiomyces ophidiicola]